MVRAVNLYMTTTAILAQHVGGSTSRGDSKATFGITWVKRRYMTLLAKPWGAGLKQGLVITAVGLVAVPAVFSNRCMFPKKGTAGFGMALLTLVIDSGMVEFRRTCSPMSTVTVGTLHLAIPYRVAKGTLDIGTDTGVAVQANRSLFGSALVRLGGGQIGMTGSTGHFCLLVGTTQPMITKCVGLVAGTANGRIVWKLGMGVLGKYSRPSPAEDQ